MQTLLSKTHINDASNSEKKNYFYLPCHVRKTRDERNKSAQMVAHATATLFYAWVFIIRSLFVGLASVNAKRMQPAPHVFLWRSPAMHPHSEPSNDLFDTAILGALDHLVDRVRFPIFTTGRDFWSSRTHVIVLHPFGIFDDNARLVPENVLGCRFAYFWATFWAIKILMQASV